MKGISDIFSLYYTEREIKKIRSARVLIIGCGGLGSNIAYMLVRSGIINLMIVDYDRIELKNLNRQQFFPQDEGKKKVKVLKENLIKLNPDVKITTVEDMVDEKKLKQLICGFKPDVVVEAVDKVWVKTMIFETVLNLKKQLVTASGVAGYGDVENIKVIRKKLYTIIGDLVSECGCCDECHKEKNKKQRCLMPLAPKVTAVAAMQADEVIRRILL